MFPVLPLDNCFLVGPGKCQKKSFYNSNGQCPFNECTVLLNKIIMMVIMIMIIQFQVSYMLQIREGYD